MRSFAALALFASSAFACSPMAPGTPGLNTTTSATFKATIQPPVTWSYGENPDLPMPPQALSAAAAKKKYEDDILQAINVILIDNKYPVDAVKLTVDAMDIKGDLITAPVGNAACTAKGLIRVDKTIVSQCATDTATAATTYNVKLSGKFDTSASGIAVTDNLWKAFGVKLQAALRDLNAMFAEDLVVTPVKN